MAKLDYFQDSGSNYQFGDKLMKPNTQVSQFDLSYVNTFTAKQGQLIPCWFSYYYPSDEFDLSIDNLIRVVNPPVVPLLSRQRVFFHMFKLDFSQMWEIWDTFMKKGWSGSFEAVIPTLSAPLAIDGAINPLLARGSLADYLGFNFSDYSYKTGDEDIEVTLPAMPFLAYQLIYRDYFLNFNIASSYAQANPGSELDVMFPDSQYDLMIRGSVVSGLTLDGSGAGAQPLKKLGLGKLRYRDFSPDYFTTALPWPMKGDVPAIDGSIRFNDNVKVSVGSSPLALTGGSLPTFSTNDGVLEYSNSGTGTGQFVVSNTLGQAIFTIPNLVPALNSTSVGFVRDTSFNSGSFPSLSSPSSSNYVINSADLNSVIAGLSITQPQLKLLWTNTLIAEKMAKTDGTYGEFIRTFFGETPSHWVSHRATYLGGTYQPIVYSEVLQTAPADSGTLGTVGAKGISSSSNHIGRFHADDYGIAMCLMSIMPDTYYSQGWLKEHLYRTQDDYPLPERALLGMQAVTTGEIFFNPRDSDANEVLFGYQSRFDELRYRQNEVHGLVADNANASFAPYVQTRNFGQAPLLNPTFLTTENNIDNEYLTAPDEVPYICQIANRVKAVRALPYFAPPSAIMM